jgi:excisionase family DNA binding protein
LSKTTPKPEIVRLAFSVEEAGHALGLSVPTIRRAINSKLMLANKCGRVHRIPAREIERVAAEGLPPIPHSHIRVTTGPTKQGRPVGSKNKAKPVPLPPAKRRKAERRVSP